MFIKKILGGASCSCSPTLEDGNFPPVFPGTRHRALKHARSRNHLILTVSPIFFSFFVFFNYEGRSKPNFKLLTSVLVTFLLDQHPIENYCQRKDEFQQRSTERYSADLVVFDCYCPGNRRTTGSKTSPTKRVSCRTRDGRIRAIQFQRF